MSERAGADEVHTAPWGAYAPRGAQRLWRALVRLGLGRGKLKKVLARCWQLDGERHPVDLDYHGIRFRLFPWDNAIEAKMLLGSRLREPEELALLEESLNGGVFIDIGANVGFYTLFALHAGAARVLAVEPNPVALARLRCNIELNGWQDRVTVEAAALGEQSGEATLSFGSADFGGGSLLGPGDHHITVPLRTLAEVVEEADVSAVDALKIDVEGSEDRVLLPYFERVEPALYPQAVIIEHLWRERWGEDVLAALARLGYRTVHRTSNNTLLQLGTETRL